MATAPNRDPMAALEAIYRRHHGLVQWVLRSRGVPEAVIDDYTHDAFVAICRRLPDRDRSLPMRTWVAGVARNVAFAGRRSRARTRDRHAQQLPPPAPPRPDELFERREAWQALSAFLDELRPEQREVFVMVDVTGMRVSEVAAATGKPANTLHSRLKVARSRFSERFGESSGQASLVAEACDDRRPSAAKRRKAWAALVGSVEGMSLVPASLASVASTSGGWFGSTALTAIVVGTGAIGVAAAVALSSPSVPETPRAQSATPSGGQVERRPATVARPAATMPDRPHLAVDASASAPARPSPPAAHKPVAPTLRRNAVPARRVPTAVADDDQGEADAQLLRAVHALQRARQQLKAGQARDALKTVDALHADFGALARDLRRIELEAACRVDDRARIDRAATALRTLGATVDQTNPCPPSSKTVP